MNAQIAIATWMYAGVLCAVSAYLSLWLDEVLQLIATRNLPFVPLLQYVAENPGGVPLGYLIQAGFLRMLGDSELAARVPSILSAVDSFIGVLVLARDSHSRRPWLSATLFALLPLQFRYATEARPYEQALCLTIWATVLFRRERAGLLYWLLAVLAIYSQPFSLFVFIAHWLSRPSIKLAFVIASAAATFAPWYLYARAHWIQAIQGSELGGGPTLKTALMIVREVGGAGYLGGVLLIALAVFAWRKSPEKWFWASWIAVPLALTLVADHVFHYFFAIRQLLFVLPPLILLAAEVVQPRPVFAALLAVIFLYADQRFLARPRDNWKTAAASIRAANHCYIALPKGSEIYYEYFEPALRRCPVDLNGAQSVVLALSPYRKNEETLAVQRMLKDKGFVSASKAGDVLVQETWTRGR